MNTAKPAIHNFVDLTKIPLRAPNLRGSRPRLDAVVELDHIWKSPTEIDHYQIQRVTDVYVTPSGEDLGKVSTRINRIIADTQTSPEHSHQPARNGARA